MSIEAVRPTQPTGSGPRILPSPNVSRILQELTLRGYLVLPPAERMSGRTHREKRSIHHRILHAFHQRMILGQKQSPDNLAIHGFTDAELSDLLSHRDLHRRTAELRACGLISQDLNGMRASRNFRGKRGTVSIITPAGIAALRELEKDTHHGTTTGFLSP